MFKALSLIVNPQVGWARIASERRGLGFVLLQYFLPIILIVLIGEGLGMMAWRHWYAGPNGMMHFTPDQVLVFEAMRFPLVPLAILACGHIVWLLREPFHAQYTYSEGLMLIAYSFCPLFLTYFLDGIPWINLWISWTLGMYFSLKILYHGINCIARTDPGHSNGLFLLSSLVIIGVMGALRYGLVLCLTGHGSSINSLISDTAAKLPF